MAKKKQSAWEVKRDGLVEKGRGVHDDLMYRLRTIDREAWKPYLIAVGLVLVAFFLVNIGYFSKQIQFSFDPSAFDAGVFSLKQELKPDTLYYRRLGIEAPIVYIEDKGEGAVQAGLAHGVIHYPETALPGELGNVYIAGHSSDLPFSQGEYKTIFALLTEAEPGDEIILTNNKKTAFRYVVKTTAVVSATDLSVTDQKNFAGRLLTLQTSYPVGTALRRFVVVAEMPGS